MVTTSYAINRLSSFDEIVSMEPQKKNTMTFTVKTDDMSRIEFQEESLYRFEVMNSFVAYTSRDVSKETTTDSATSNLILQDTVYAVMKDQVTNDDDEDTF
jgi:Cu2+-containing amine oxidase